MASTYTIALVDNGFTATVSQDDQLNWSWTLTRNGQTQVGSFPPGFAFTSAFVMGANNDYLFGAGSVVTPGTQWRGTVNYPQANQITTTWTATKKAAAHKHEAA
jgi:hypothetical protein